MNKTTKNAMDEPSRGYTLPDFRKRSLAGSNAVVTRRPKAQKTLSRLADQMASAVPSFLFVLTLATASYPAQAQTFKVLYRFTGGADGFGVNAPPLVVSGKLYGTTYQGGAVSYPNGYGTVFSVDLQTGQFTTLHAFAGPPSDGLAPIASMIQDSAGNVYGATTAGGANNYGTVFEISPAGALTILYSFDLADGAGPSALALDSAGNLYGAAGAGGTNSEGTIFKLDQQGNLTTLFSFGPSTALGIYPCGLSLQGTVLYGTTGWGGLHNDGTLFSVDTTTGEMAVLHRFTGGADGGSRRETLAAPIGDGDGHLYGMTSNGGHGGRYGHGVLYKIRLANDKETVLHTFGGRPDGEGPIGSLVRDVMGNLYGATAAGGTHNRGTIFKLDPAGTLTILYSFKGLEDGALPVGVALDSTGKLYGLATSGGKLTGCGGSGCGTIFEITP